MPDPMNSTAWMQQARERAFCSLLPMLDPCGPGMTDIEIQLALLDAVAVGDIVHVRSASRTGHFIRHTLNLWLPKDTVWGNHDGLVVEYPKDSGQLWVGDEEPPRAHLTTLAEYKQGVIDGKWQVRVFRPRLWTPEKGKAASVWWCQNVLGRPYNYIAYPRLILRCVFGELLNIPQLFDKILKIHFCTDSVSDSYLYGAFLDVYLNVLPTPYTTEKRATDAGGGTLVERTV